MKSPRLLPVVIFAGVALLAFKGIGLVTDGGYVLSGTTSAVASEGAVGASVDNAAPRTEPTVSDSNPTLSDPAPTMQLAAPAATGGHAAAPAHEAAAPDTAPVVPDISRDSADGHPVLSTEQAVLQRLGQRRAELDKRAAELDMRDGLVKAAERQLQERTDALKALQDQITQLQQQKLALEDEQFAGIVTMYSTMKAQEAAAIFNGLDMAVLTRVAKAMQPRKMSAILAKMSAARAQELTQQLASLTPQVADTVPAITTAALPQIIGH